MCFNTQGRYFAAIRNGDTAYVLSHSKRHLHARNDSDDATQEFTGLMCAVYYDRQEIAEHLYAEITDRTLHTLDVQVGDKIIKLAPNSSAFHIALLMHRHDIAKSMIEYVKKQHSKHLMDELCKPN